jgi:hypothetical protein
MEYVYNMLNYNIVFPGAGAGPLVRVSQIEVPDPLAAQKRIIMIETGRGFTSAS